MNELLNELERAAWGGFVGTQGRLFQRIEEDLRQNSGITHAEFEVLLRLRFAEGGRQRLQDLAAASLLSRSGTSRAVGRLVRAGLMSRVDAEEDGRGAYAVLSAAGKKRFERAAGHHLALVRAQFLRHFSVEELKVLAGFWRRLKAADLDAPSPEPVTARRSPRRRARS